MACTRPRCAVVGALLIIAPTSFAFGPPTAAHTTRPNASPRALRPPVFAAAARVVEPCAVTTSTPNDLEDDLEETPKNEIELDAGALGRYLFAVLIQMILVTTVFGVVDLISYGPLPGDAQLGGPLPWQAVVGIFLVMSVRSRLFSPLDNSRPELRTGVVARRRDRHRRQWT